MGEPECRRCGFHGDGIDEGYCSAHCRSMHEVEQKCDGLRTKLAEAEHWGDVARAEARDNKEAYERTLNEACTARHPFTDDRVHCTCVPHLREGVRALTKECDDLKVKLAQFDVNTNTGRCPYSREPLGCAVLKDYKDRRAEAEEELANHDKVWQEESQVLERREKEAVENDEENAVLHRKLTEAVKKLDGLPPLDLAGAMERIQLDNAVCICGCPHEQHESLGEDGEQCEHEDHECIRVCPAARDLFVAARGRADGVIEAAKREADHHASISRMCDEKGNRCCSCDLCVAIKVLEGSEGAELLELAKAAKEWRHAEIKEAERPRPSVPSENYYQAKELLLEAIKALEESR